MQPRTERRLRWQARVVPAFAAALLAAAVATGTLLYAFRRGQPGGAIPVDAAALAGLHLLGRNGRSVLAAYLPRRW